jgi:hypothetical protein
MPTILPSCRRGGPVVDVGRCSAQRLLALIAAAAAMIASNVILHPLLGPTAAVAEAASSSSSPASIPTPNPEHDERQCPFCLAGSGVFAASPAEAGLDHSADSPPLPRPARAAEPRTRAASPEAARAPPHELRS